MPKSSILKKNSSQNKEKEENLLVEVSLPEGLDTIAEQLWKEKLTEKEYNGCVGAGCGSSEYEFANEEARKKAVKLLAEDLIETLNYCCITVNSDGDRVDQESPKFKVEIVR